MAKYLDVFTDFGFKKIFGEEANKAILIDFFNALLPVRNHVKDLTFKNSERLGTTSEERKAIYDIYCENENGEKFIVELQKVKQNYFKDRTIYYSTFPLSEQAVKGGDWDYNLKAVFCIGLLDFRFNDYNDEQEKKRVAHTITLKDQDGRNFYDKLTYIYLEMPNFNKAETELETRLDKWLYFIKNLEDFQSIPEIFKGEAVFIEAFEKAELAKMNEEERIVYNFNLKTYRDSYSMLKTAKEEGLTQGIGVGVELKTWKVVKNMLEMGMAVADIAKATDVEESKITEYKKSL
ncbi:MAG: PD-(D/E)XK nuclease family transposase [Taibaiella sp.]|nr:PD-(D/E)XK nuclease family transposase [Taibaiella sp.]